MTGPGSPASPGCPARPGRRDLTPRCPGSMCAPAGRSGWAWGPRPCSMCRDNDRDHSLKTGLSSVPAPVPSQNSGSLPAAGPRGRRRGGREETPLCAACQPASYAVAFTPDGHTLTVVVDREEMSANSGRDTIFDWPVTDSGALGAVTARRGRRCGLPTPQSRHRLAARLHRRLDHLRRPRQPPQPTSAGNTEPATRRTGCTVASSDEGTGSAAWSRAAGRKGEFGR